MYRLPTLNKHIAFDMENLQFVLHNINVILYSLSVCSWGMTLETAYLRQPMRRFLKGKYFFQKRNLFFRFIFLFQMRLHPLLPLVHRQPVLYTWAQAFLQSKRPFENFFLTKITHAMIQPLLTWPWHHLAVLRGTFTWRWGQMLRPDCNLLLSQISQIFKKKVNQLLLKSDYI